MVSGSGITYGGDGGGGRCSLVALLWKVIKVHPGRVNSLMGERKFSLRDCQGKVSRYTGLHGKAR